MTNTVEENVKCYTGRKVRCDEVARRLMTIIRGPSEQQLCRQLDERHICNYDVSGQDVLNEHRIFQTGVKSLKCKPGRSKEPHVDLIVRPITDGIRQRHKEVVVCFDTMHIGSIAFLTSKSLSAKFCTAEAWGTEVLRRCSHLLIG